MIKQLVGGLAAAALVVGISASAHAQCTFQHPQKAGGFAGNFVQAFVSCGNNGGNSPNTVAGGGAAPACSPPETYSEQACGVGGCASGWLWGPKGKGQVKFKALKKAFDPTTTPGDPDTSDLVVKLSVKDIEYPGGSGLVTGNGTLSTLSRTTFDDRTAGDVTIVDFPVKFPFTVTDGKGKLKRSADQQLNLGNLAGLPHCTSIETVKVTIQDEAGHAFGSIGLFLP